MESGVEGFWWWCMLWGEMEGILFCEMVVVVVVLVDVSLVWVR